MSWRLSQRVLSEVDGSVDPFGMPTLVKGENYPPGTLSYDNWCLPPGLFQLSLYDDNEASATNSSKGWDGGSLAFTDAAGCVFADVSIPFSEEFAAAEIHSVRQYITVPAEGQCGGGIGGGGAAAAASSGGAATATAAAPPPRFLDVSKAPAGGTCPFEPRALAFCIQQPKLRPVAEVNQGARASWDMCAAVCSVALCWDRMFELYGPVPLDYGCRECEQEAGDALAGDSGMLKNFSLWQFHPNGTDYDLVIRTRTAAGSSSGPAAARYFAQTNRVIGGVLLRQYRKTPRDCSQDRFGQLETATQPSFGDMATRTTVRTTDGAKRLPLRNRPLQPHPSFSARETFPRLCHWFRKDRHPFLTHAANSSLMFSFSSPQCVSRGEEQGTAPFGMDPTFISSSPLFDASANLTEAAARGGLGDRGVPHGEAPRLPLLDPSSILLVMCDT